VIVGTLAALAILAVTAAPGRVFERRVDQRAPRAPRSQLAEYIELVMAGEAATLASVLLVGLIAQLTGLLDVGALLRHAGDYVRNSPGRVIGCALAALVLSYLVADLAARLLYPVPSDKQSREMGVYRQHTIWYDALEKERPKGYGVVVTVEMTDGCQFLGSLAGFTPTDMDNREIALEGEIAIRRPGRDAERFTGGDFLLIREDQIKYMAGRYNPPEHAA